MPESDLFRLIGGTSGCHRLAKAFYGRVDRDPLLRPLFPGKSLRCAIDAFAAFLVQFLGGPVRDSQKRWWLSLRESHARFPMMPEYREAWMRQMTLALEDAGFSQPIRGALLGFFARASSYIAGNEPGTEAIHPELAQRWHAQQALDDAVAALRSGDAARAIALAEDSGRGARAGLFAMMIGNGDDDLLSYVHDQLLREPALVHEQYGGWTLLHYAAAAGRLKAVEILLSLGADPNALDGGRHTPLYSLGNGCLGCDCADVVRALVRAGAEVNAHAGVTRCTPLHMAARRGNTASAEALLDCGAEINARDSNGNTPLMRAINCRKTEVEAFLRSRGASSG